MGKTKKIKTGSGGSDNKEQDDDNKDVTGDENEEDGSSGERRRYRGRDGRWGTKHTIHHRPNFRTQAQKHLILGPKGTYGQKRPLSMVRTEAQ